MNNNEKVKKLAGLGVLTALVIGLQLFSNYVPLGAVSINFGIIPALIGAMIYGPIAGLALGLVDGALCIAAPSTITIFFPVSIPLTVILCLLKTGVAGLVSGLLYKGLSKKNEKAAVISSSMIMPVVNTAIFCIGAILFFVPALEGYMEPLGMSNIYQVLFLGFVGWNFFVEFGVIALLSAGIFYIVRIYTMKNRKAATEGEKTE